MAGFKVEAIVGAKPQLHGYLDSEVEAVETGPNPCPICKENAESADPLPPPLHPHCHCELISVNASAFF